MGKVFNPHPNPLPVLGEGTLVSQGQSLAAREASTDVRWIQGGWPAVVLARPRPVVYNRPGEISRRFGAWGASIDQQLVIEAATLTGIGMATAFGLLLLLIVAVVAVRLISKCVVRARRRGDRRPRAGRGRVAGQGAGCGDSRCSARFTPQAHRAPRGPGLSG